MEDRIKIDELAGVKIQNCTLRLSLLDIEAKKVAKERDDLLKAESIRLGVSLEEYVFDINAHEFVKRET